LTLNQIFGLLKHPNDSEYKKRGELHLKWQIYMHKAANRNDFTATKLLDLTW